MLVLVVAIILIMIIRKSAVRAVFLLELLFFTTCEHVCTAFPSCMRAPVGNRRVLAGAVFAWIYVLIYYDDNATFYGIRNA